MTMLEDRPSGIPNIDPRIRQRWVEARRAEGRRRLRALLVFLAVVAVISGAIGVLYSPLFKVRHVRISLGAMPVGSNLTAAAVRARAGLEGERLMVHISTAAETRLVEGLPWVASARVRREWPGTVRITVTARGAVAVTDRVPGHPADGLAALDPTGRVLARPAPSGLAAGLPLLGGLPAPGPAGSWLAGSADHLAPRWAAELATAAALSPGLRTQVTTIGEGRDGLTLIVGRTTFAFGDTTELAEKVAALETVLDDVSVGHYSLVDLRVPDRPALTPRHPGH